VLRHVFGVVLCRLSLVHGVEIEFGIIVLDRLEVHAQRLLDACWGQFRDDSLSCVSKNAPSRVNVDRFPALILAHRNLRLMGQMWSERQGSSLAALVEPMIGASGGKRSSCFKARQNARVVRPPVSPSGLLPPRRDGFMPPRRTGTSSTSPMNVCHPTSTPRWPPPPLL
jgi:hypothetical protein